MNIFLLFIHPSKSLQDSSVLCRFIRWWSSLYLDQFFTSCWNVHVLLPAVKLSHDWINVLALQRLPANFGGCQLHRRTSEELSIRTWCLCVCMCVAGVCTSKRVSSSIFLMSGSSSLFLSSGRYWRSTGRPEHHININMAAVVGLRLIQDCIVSYSGYLGIRPESLGYDNYSFWANNKSGTSQGKQVVRNMEKVQHTIYDEKETGKNMFVCIHDMESTWWFITTRTLTLLCHVCTVFWVGVSKRHSYGLKVQVNMLK